MSSEKEWGPSFYGFHLAPQRDVVGSSQEHRAVSAGVRTIRDDEELQDARSRDDSCQTIGATRK